MLDLLSRYRVYIIYIIFYLLRPIHVYYFLSLIILYHK
nr:MAG TPA: hypothetical protein [Caudoviricetes sp.]